MKKILISATAFVFIFTLLLAFPQKASAHCDTLDGPVVSAARRALATNNVNYVLIWVKPENEDEIRKALKKSGAKRKKARTKEEKDKAEMEFFGTLVKVHREGEGAKYEGIKPAGTAEPEIAAADETVKTGQIEKILKRIADKRSQEKIRHLFQRLQEKSDYAVDDVPAGREFIEAYVIFIHAVEKALKGGLPVFKQ